jgi:hypothetical protein
MPHVITTVQGLEVKEAAFSEVKQARVLRETDYQATYLSRGAKSARARPNLRK